MTAEYVDDPTIADEDPLWRRIPPFHIIFDAKLRNYRPSSAAFDDRPKGTHMSVVLANDVLAAGRTPESVLAGHENYGMVQFAAGVARSLNLGIVRRPVPEEPAHAEVFGKKTDAVKKALRRNSVWIISPPQANSPA